MTAPHKEAPDAVQGTEGKSNTAEAQARTETSTLAALVAIQSNQISILAAELEKLKRDVAWLKAEEQVRQWSKLGAS